MKTLIVTAALAIVFLEAPLPPKKTGQPCTSYKAGKECKTTFNTTNYILKIIGLGALIGE
ncbi:hypothetical protein [Mucilaginibacter sp. PAMB04168]|uniref:hypothetical protein n=1 Tax=Mucilaginibacter sp. PAMB04168 TaxID=3138567 RepID=UPI0031F685CF